MSNLILDYREYSKNNVEYGMNSPNGDQLLFHGKLGWCPFCYKSANKVSNKGTSFTYDFGSWREMTEEVWQCECGWWQVYFYSYMEEVNSFKDWYKCIHSAQLKKFEIGARDIPIKTLRSYIEENPNKIYSIHDKKMEQLVASVFRDFFQCEVEEVGKSHDGGVDLILIKSDVPTIIQVKRRMSSKKVESVKEIRDLLGASMLTESRNCMFVTTADHFSKDAVNSRDIAIKVNAVDSFELFDCKRFLDMLNLTSKQINEEWNKYLQFETNLQSK
jgi:hypothetical protein